MKVSGRVIIVMKVILVRKLAFIIYYLSIFVLSIH